MFKQSVFADTMASCDGAGLCYVKHDGLAPFEGRVVLNITSFASGECRTAADVVVSLPAGAGAIHWLSSPAVAAIDGAHEVLEAVVLRNDGMVQISPQPSLLLCL